MSTLRPKELRELATHLYGEHGWQTRLAEDLGVDTRTVRYWVSGAVPVPGPAAKAIQSMADVKALMIELNRRA